MDAEVKGAGRPRSEDARRAVLRAVDDLLIEEGYAAMTMKGIAERAQVGRQTVYRWWSSKAEILLEASATDAERELAVRPAPDSRAEVVRFLDALARFLTTSDAGLAYRALLGEAQHDRAVAEMVRDADMIGVAARRVLRRLADRAGGERGVAAAREADVDARVAELVGPLVYRILVEGEDPKRGELQRMADRFLAG